MYKTSFQFHYMNYTDMQIVTYLQTV